ncbi:hypothetical protein V8F06_008061 [Rhypophila decipiens]
MTEMASLSPSRASSQVMAKTTTTNKPLPPIPEPLTSAALLSTLDTFHRSLSHTRYAVSGTAALTVWGYTGRLPNRVSVLCCSSDKQIIRTWAKVAGWYLYPSTPDVIGLPSNQQGLIRRIKLKGIDSDEAFEAQERVSPADLLSTERGIIPTQATVLTPTALLNHFAMQYLVHSQQGTAEHAQKAGDIGKHIIWILERMNSSLQLISHLQRERTGVVELFIPPTGRDVSRLLSYAVDKKFRARFDGQFPGAVHLWTRCGLDYSDTDDAENCCPLSPAPLRRPSMNTTTTTGSTSTRTKRRGIYSSSSGSTSRSTSSPSPADRRSPSLIAVDERDDDMHDELGLNDWQLPDDLKIMMDQAAAEYHGRDIWR